MRKIAETHFLFSYLFLVLGLSHPIVHSIYQCLTKRDRQRFACERVRRQVGEEVLQLARCFQFEDCQWLWTNEDDGEALLTIRLRPRTIVTIDYRVESKQVVLYVDPNGNPSGMIFPLSKQHKWIKALRRALLCAVFLERSKNEISIAEYEASEPYQTLRNREPEWTYDLATFQLWLHKRPNSHCIIQIEGQSLPLAPRIQVTVDFSTAKSGIARLRCIHGGTGNKWMVDLPTLSSCVKATADIVKLCKD